MLSTDSSAKVLKRQTKHTNMCTPWTVTRFVRLRMRDCASCFMALDDEQASSAQVKLKKTDYGKKEYNRANRIYEGKLSRSSKKSDQKMQINNCKEKDKYGVSVGNRLDDSSWQLSADEDYIVLCFKEEGAFDVVKHGKSVHSEVLGSFNGKPRNSTPVNRKLDYGVEADRVHKERTYEKRSTASQHVQHCKGAHKEDNEKDIEDRGMLSADSRDSQGSTGSFAFPVLGWEWIGSPVQMPKTESLQLRKHKGRSAAFQCCRF